MYLERLTHYLEDAENRGVALPIGVLEGYRPSTGYLCTIYDCSAHFVRMEVKADGQKRFMYAVCKVYSPSTRSLRHLGSS